MKVSARQSLRSRLYVLFLIIISINVLTILYQYIQIYNYHEKFKENESAASFLIIKKMLLENFEQINKKYDVYGGELENRLNTLYNLIREGYFKEFTIELTNAKKLISSNILEGAYNIFLISFDGNIIASTDHSQNLFFIRDEQYLDNLKMLRQEQGKILVGPPMLCLQTQNIYMQAMTYSPQLEKIIAVSYKTALPDEIAESIVAIKKQFDTLVSLHVYMVNPTQKILIDFTSLHVATKQGYIGFLNALARNLSDRIVTPLPDTELLNRIKQTQHTLLSRRCEENCISSYIAISHQPFSYSNDYNILIEASLVEIKSNDFNMIQKSLLITSLLAMLMIFLFYFVMRVSVIVPLEKIAEHLLKNTPITDKKLLESNNEISRFAKSFNALQRRLSHHVVIRNRLLEEQKLFISNSIHELSTPLSVIGTNASILEMEYGINEPLIYISSAIKQINNIKEDIAYAMLNSDINYQIESVNVCQFIKNRINYFSQVAFANEKQISFYCTDEILIDISPIEFGLLVDNNLSNGIKYGKINSRITVTIKSSPSGFILEFSSFGEQIYEPTKIFERFYREDTQRRGFGIGLNIVKNICKKYGFKYEVSSENGLNHFRYFIDRSKELHEDLIT